jgi:3-hexulose-6-phosphate synthase/6-phospho-3-hexuloisomerase
LSQVFVVSNLLPVVEGANNSDSASNHATLPEDSPVSKKSSAFNYFPVPEGEIPPVQLALDLYNIDQACRIAEESIRGGVSFIEAGTPLIKAEGMEAVRILKRKFPQQVIVADMKTMDGGAIEVEIAAKAGAEIVLILGVADDSCIREAVLAGKKYGAMIGCDLIQCEDPVARAVQLEKLGVDIICVHVGLDQQVLGMNPIEITQRVSEVLHSETIIGIAGGLNQETAVQAYQAAARNNCIIIIGGAFYKSPQPEQTARDIIRSLHEGKPVYTSSFKKFSEDELYSAFMRVSTCNISDAMHRSGEMRGIRPLWYGTEETPLKFAGRAVTVRTYNGDWSNTVEAIDQCSRGSVLVIDACSGEDAVWGELATWSCKSQGVAGVIIDGAVRDIDDIIQMKFPLFARHFTPTAGEPRGMGEINSEIVCGGQSVAPGDWIIADNSGVVVVPKAIAMEMANRAIDVAEREDRIREEIQRGSTLSKVLELKKWHKVGLG